MNGFFIMHTKIHAVQRETGVKAIIKEERSRANARGQFNASFNGVSQAIRGDQTTVSLNKNAAQLDYQNNHQVALHD
jgi:hypothetical protein